jgi:hypothetical protein
MSVLNRIISVGYRPGKGLRFNSFSHVFQQNLY